MPAWKTLDDEQTWDIVAYLLSVAAAPPEAKGERAAGG
jgi:mono/diheme cytochrome c family protein